MGDTKYDFIKDSIIAEYSGLGDGETRSGQICPACHGGATQEGSLSVTKRDGVLLYNCFRASCSARGSTGASAEPEQKSKKTVVKRPHVPVSRLDAAITKFLAVKFRVPGSVLELAELGWTGEGTSVYARRISFPIFGPDSRQRGQSYRSYEGKKPKAIVKLYDDEALAFCWYKWTRTSNVLILVEDQMSAIKLASFYHSAALLGINLNEAKIEEILHQADRYDRIYLSLDNDASYEAIKQQLKWKNKLPNLMVMGLQKDIKDMDDEELREYLGRIS